MMTFEQERQLRLLYLQGASLTEMARLLQVSRERVMVSVMGLGLDMSTATVERRHRAAIWSALASRSGKDE